MSSITSVFCSEAVKKSRDTRASPESGIAEKMLPDILSDNSELHRLTERLEKSEARYALAVRGSGVAIWDWDITQDELYLAPLFFSMLGMSASDMLDGNYPLSFLQERIHPEDTDDVNSILCAHLDRGFAFSAECRLRREDDVYIYAFISGQAQWDDNRRPQRMAGTIIDVSERYHAVKQLSASNDELQRFAYICSHDLKEPARIVDNFSRLLHKQYHDSLGERAQEYLGHIRLSAVRMQEMISSILAYSQAEHKHTQHASVDCRAEAEKALENLKLSIEEAGAEIVLGGLPHISADRTQIFQVFLNLIGNALKFRGKNAPIITVSAKKKNANWLFSVADNGIGMEQRHADSIFGVFSRLHDTSQYAGTGIGLSICHRVVAKHNGKIWVKSSPGKGATFYFTIPIKR